MPNLPVDGNSWGRSACYPRRTFYPLSDGLSTKGHRITRTDLRLCSTCGSCSQAGFCSCTHQLISDQPEPTIVRLRYNLGGDRPSQTPHHAGSWVLGTSVRRKRKRGWSFTGCLHLRWRGDFIGSHLGYTRFFSRHCKARVKVHGVFPSNRGNPVSSRGIQFH